MTVWGCRGSVSISNADVLRYGGHTTCLELELEDARLLIDAGSGLIEQHRQRPGTPKDTLLLLSHLHWDHILGFPFYPPLYQHGWNLDVRGVPRDGVSVYDGLVDVNRPPLFPVDLRHQVRAAVTSQDLDEQGSLTFHGVRVDWMPVWHPGGCSAFKLTVGERTVVFTGDVELPKTDLDALAAFARGADILLCDAQYDAKEYAQRVGWGHSSNLHAAALARSAEVERLILTHHDPLHDDAFIDGLVDEARDVFPRTEAAAAAMTLFDTLST
jgi:phosphoribosyl 1,2-cyclic phosphodiesterase